MSKSQQEKPAVTAARQEQKNSVRMSIRMLVVLYLGFIIYQLVKGYTAGDADLSKPLFIGAVVFFSIVEILIIVFSVISWRKGQEKAAELRARQKAEAAQDEEEKEVQ